MKLPEVKVKSALEPQDARYVRSRSSIRKVLHEGLAERRINLKLTDICQAATISRPTFYAHWASADDALRKYETSLHQDFSDRLPEAKVSKPVIFTMLLSFMRDEQGYFQATMPTANYWLLQSLFDEIRPRLVSKATDKSYDLYVQAQIALIGCWVKYEHFSNEKMPLYVNKLSMTRVMDLGI